MGFYFWLGSLADLRLRFGFGKVCVWAGKGMDTRPGSVPKIPDRDSGREFSGFRVGTSGRFFTSGTPRQDEDMPT